jgi:hypothetical protein
LLHLESKAVEGWRFSSMNPQAGQEKLLAAGRAETK